MPKPAARWILTCNSLLFRKFFAEYLGNSMNTIFARSLRLIAVTIALAGFATAATAADYYSAVISPTSVSVNSTDINFQIVIEACGSSSTNCGGLVTSNATHTLKSATVTVPSGYTVDGATVAVVASTGTWNAALSGNSILLDKNATNLPVNGSLTLTFQADVGCEAGSEWTTIAYNDTTRTTAWVLAGTQPTVTLTGSCEVFTGFETGDYCTIGQGGWHAVPNGNNPGVLLETWFDTVYPSGLVVGDHFTMSFDSAADVRAYLAGNSTPGALDDDYVNPTTDNSSGVFGGQVTALALNVDFNYEGYLQGSEGPVGSLHLFDTGLSLDGSTVTDILDAANTALGGGAGAPPGDYTYSSLNDLVDDLNTSFEYCDPSDWAQQHLRP